MGHVSISDVWPPQDRPLTVRDLERLPDDGNRYELDEGVLVVTPAPFSNHQRVVTRLTTLLEIACPAEYEVLSGPGIMITESDQRIPDLAVIRAAWFEEEYPTKPPVLTVEVSSGATALLDRNRKKTVYERFGIPYYWIITPDLGCPTLTAFELMDGCYQQIAHVVADEVFHAKKPFPVELAPSWLVMSHVPDSVLRRWRGDPDRHNGQ